MAPGVRNLPRRIAPVTVNHALGRRIVPATIALLAVALGTVLAVPGLRASSAPAGWVAFRDRAAGISLAYPRSWRRLQPADPAVRLIARGAAAALLVRVAALPFDGGHDPERAERQLAAAALAGSPRARRIGGSPVTLGARQAYLFGYTFPEAGHRGLHLEYLLVRRRRLLTLVLQSSAEVPTPSVTRQFRRIAASFRSSR